MQKVRIINLDGNENFLKKLRKSKHFIKMEDNLFELGLRKGLIEKNENEYCFIGDKEELIAFTHVRPDEIFEWLD